jgi:transposase
MFLRCKIRKKNGKEHRSWSVVENRRLGDGRVVQRHVLYLGEINDSQNLAWRKSVAAFLEGQPDQPPATLALFPADQAVEAMAQEQIVRLHLAELKLCRPRQWGACWLALHLWREVGLDQFWLQRLPPNRKGTRWDQILAVLVCYRLLDPGSEWQLHRQWFLQSALADLLGGDFGLAEEHKLYQCHDHLLRHKAELFTHLRDRWRDLFNASFEVLLYDLTSTYFESHPPFPPGDKRRYGYSRDKRSDCVQVVIALIVTPEGFPLAYEVLSGNTSDKTTLQDFLARIEKQYGKAQRIWIMDRGIPTEETLEQMRTQDPPVQYLVGTPKGRLTQYEQALLAQPWQRAREGVHVKLLPQDGELYVLAQSQDRVAKERSMRRRQLKWLWRRLKEIQAMELSRDRLMKKLGVAQHEAPTAWRLVAIAVAETKKKQRTSFTFQLRKDKLRITRRREGRYLLRSNLTETDPGKLWSFYLQLTQVEEAFKNLKGDLAIRPIYHQVESRIEAHIFIAFLAYCLHVTLGRRLRDLAPGLTTRSVLEKFAAVQMLDVRIPTTDQREVVLTRYTQPEPELQLLLEKLKLELPPQPPPKITAPPRKADEAM